MYGSHFLLGFMLLVFLIKDNSIILTNTQQLNASFIEDIYWSCAQANTLQGKPSVNTWFVVSNKPQPVTASDSSSCITSESLSCKIIN